MTGTEAISILRLVTRARIELDHDRISETKAILFNISEAVCLIYKVGDEDLISAGVPVCICPDDRGWSTCGGACSYHSPDYICLCGGCGNCKLEGEDRACKRRVAYMRRCHKCDTEP